MPGLNTSPDSCYLVCTREESRQITVDRHGRSLKLGYKAEQKRQAVTVQRRLQWLDRPKRRPTGEKQDRERTRRPTLNPRPQTQNPKVRRQRAREGAKGRLQKLDQGLGIGLERKEMRAQSVG